MIIGTVKEREVAINILCQSFQNITIPNSINFIVGLGENRSKRLRALMSYQYDLCLLYGSAFITSDLKGVVLYLEKPKQSLKKIYLELKLIFKCIGLKNVWRIMERENIVKKNHPEDDFTHLWLMGILPESQGKGVGTKLITESMKVVENEKIFLETTTPENLQFYKKNGFSIFKETHELNYPLYFLSNV